MIVTRLKGGLGNQMFQYAAGKALSLHLDTTLRTDGSFLTGAANPVVTKRSFELDCFGIPDDTANSMNWISLLRRTMNSRPAQFTGISRMLNWKVYHEASFSFDPVFFEQKGNLILEGYWQSEKYFGTYAEEIRQAFRLKRPLSERSIQLEQRIREMNTISVHVRRGDLVTNSHAAKEHGVLTMDYYREALKALKQAEPSAVVIVFSDDPGFVAQQMQFLEAEVVVDWNKGRNYEDLHLMSCCSHHIIANSSFSWWGAWLNASASKKVVAPRRWFANSGLDTSTLLPSAWIKI